MALMAFASDGLAGKAPVTVEVAPPPATFGTDAAGLKSVAQTEVKNMEALPKDRSKRGVVISLALTQTSSTPIACSVNATVRDAKSGAVLAIIETNAHADGAISTEIKKEMAFAVVRDAIKKVPSALQSAPVTIPRKK